MRDERLADDDLRARLLLAPEWTLSDDALSIRRTFTFASFVEAFGFMAESALAAEKLDHHPDWSNVYSRVEVRLTTHDSAGVTERDFQLAKAMDRAAARRN